MNARPLTTSIAALVTLVSGLLPTPGRSANEIGFIEKFALAPDREKALGELVPGSEEYYFFHALHYQNTRNEAKLAEILKQWETRFPNETSARRVILNREALLDYDATPQQTLEYLKDRLNLQFNHQQEARDQKPNLPTKLDPTRVAREVYEKDALANDSGVQSIAPDVLENLVRNRAQLKIELRRAILGRLTRPDVPNLVEFIADELKSKESGGFGQFAIHRALLPDQLDALAKLVPGLATNDQFVSTKMRKLAPNADADIEFDADEREAWLTRVWAYAKTLPPAFNTLKAQVLYRRLDHDRKRGVYDRALFLEYLNLPRNSVWVNPKWLENTVEKQPSADLNANLAESLIVHRPIGNDEALVREYFLELFQRAAANGEAGVELLDPYKSVVRESWLKPVLAEALITGGIGTPERWASLISPQEFQKLKERVDLEFPQTNTQFFTPGADVQFDVTVKNTPKVLVKIYELNALNFFLTQNRQLNTDLSLDGLVANSERTETFETGPFKRTKTTFKFPELKGRRGAWIVEFIGGGRSSRALVRVGQWQVVQTVRPGGDLLTVLDEQGAPVKDAVAWLDDRKYPVDEKLGGILAPFTRQAGTRPVVLSDPTGSFAVLTQFERHVENYALDVQFHIEREQLLSGHEATLAVRPSLLLGTTYLDPALLQEARLAITSQTLDGISTTTEIKDLKLSAGGVLVQKISVPDRLAQLSVTFQAKIDVVSAGGEKRDLSGTRAWTVNGIDRTGGTSDGHLSKFDGNYVYELLGKNGEPLAEQQVVFTITRRGFSQPQTVPLKTDEKGRIQLGNLRGLRNVQATPPDNRSASWELDETERTWANTVHTGANQAIRIPLPPALAERAAQAGDPKAELRRAASLLQLNAGTYTADLSNKLSTQDGFLVIEGLAPGDYDLLLRSEQLPVSIKVSGGQYTSGWYLGKARNLEAKAEAPLQISQVQTDNDFITIKIANANLFTRVHVAASRFEPGQGLFAGLGGFTRFGAGSGRPARLPNLYSAGREIGDEYRYILDRRYAKIFPGNMLTRPGLLLNPWATRDTGLEGLTQQAAAQAMATGGDRFGTSVLGQGASGSAHFGISGSAAESNLDFLAEAAPTLYNLIPDKDGLVKIDRKSLGDRQHVQIYAEDLTSAVWRSFALPEVETKFRDLRLMRNLDPAKPFTQKKEVAILVAGKSLTLDDVLTGEMETYDTLGGIHSLFTTLRGHPRLVEFAWILQWPKMKDEEKRAKYSEYACHELNFFLMRKDPEFFDKVIKPYLANKKDKTFLDDFLLGADLAKYLQPSFYEDLNAVERALLAQRLPAAAANIDRQLREAWQLLPPNPERLDQLFETALRGRALEADVSGMITGTAGVTKSGGGALRLAQRNAGITNGEPFAESAPLTAAGRVNLSEAAAHDRLERGASVPADDLRSLNEETKKLSPAAKERLGQLQADKEGRDEQLRTYKLYSSDRLYSNKTDGDFSFAGEGEGRTARGRYRALYRQLGATKEWAENNYYQLRIGEQNASLVQVNAFWRDYAAYVAGGSQGAFVSPNVAEAGGNFTEMMLALTVLDLPFDAPKHTIDAHGGQLTLTAAGPVIVYHKQIKPAAPAAAAPQGQLLVSQSFFREGDRYRQDGNEKVEKYVTDEFLTGAVYGANVVVTNPTSSLAKAEVLLQIPQGALTVMGSKPTQSRSVRLEPYTTQTFQYYFYFPSVAKEGAKFPHFPVNVAIGNTAAAAAKPFAFQVVGKLTQVDKASWDYVSQYSTEAEVFTFLEQNNLALLNFDRVAWRCKDAAFFKKLTAFLQAHHLWSDTIYSYAIVHNDPAALREWLKHRDDFLSQCGPYLSSKLLLLDPIERRSYEHLEYSPLVNQRAHPLGAEARIANPAVLGQYQSLLTVLAHKPQLDALDGLSVTYYQFLQDRVDEALTRFKTIDAKVLPTQIQYDYLRCYADFYESNLAEARGVAAKYADFPIARWRNLFGEVTSQLDEIEGKPGVKKPDDQPDREKEQALLAASEPSVDFKVENKTIALTWKNLGAVTLNYYLMDPEFSFSSSPFVSEDASRFSIIKPSFSATQELPKGQDKLDVPLPPQFAKANVLIEVVAAGQRKAQAYHSNTLKLTLTETYGRLEARDRTTDQPLPKTYVKVYARLTNGNVRFFKDGYTDLRGRFDYASLNGSGQANLPPTPEPLPKNGLDYQMLKPGELNSIEKLSLLILSETNGATTKEVNPPRD